MRPPGVRSVKLIALLSAAVLAFGATPASAAPAAKTGPKTVAYIEVNSNSMLNAGKYTLANGGAPVFDIAVIFAANINYDTAKKKAYLYFNPQVQQVLDNAATQIRPLQAKGIKVVLSVLGNHQGAGFANFPDKAAAEAFAKECSDAVAKYGLDGIDFDDEWAEYGKNGTGQPNDFSFVYLVSKLRDTLPDKLINLYDIGEAASKLSYGGVNIGPKFSYALQAYYGSWGVPKAQLPKDRLGPAAVEINSSSNAAALAKRTVSEGYGAYVTYNLTASNATTYISGFTKELYGSAAVYTR
ncbi:chitinase [Pseudonocardiaceae bacterium YIM PH 21723]|nr:chitinase [Pseudonocardiaceae bacterium YIM PH 21723]